MAISIYLPDDAATEQLAAWLAPRLRGGDAVLLQGALGAGKSHFARALVRARLGRPEEVPSPSFTLVQVYDAGEVEIWHADLYRLHHPDEVSELGLADAFATAICLVEWPDRLGSLTPPDALTLTLAAEGDARRALITGGRAGLLVPPPPGHVGPRETAKQGFLAALGWGDAIRQGLAGDASDRSYDRLTRRTETAVLMDAPPGAADDPARFVAIAAHLRGLGLSAPCVLGQDLEAGFVLLEDLGDALFARIIADDPAREADLYHAAVDVLIHVQARPVPPGLPNLTAGEWAEAASVAFDWYRFAITGDRADTADFRAALASALTAHADGPRVLALRDYHAENLLWLPERLGLARVGLLDFQLAQGGQPGYDLVSLLQDARRDVAPQTEKAMIPHFARATHRDLPAFRQSYAVLGAQRALRILGVFARLCLVAGKAGYLPLLPRVWGQLQRNLAQPGLEHLAATCAALPPPSPAALSRIEAQCGAFR